MARRISGKMPVRGAFGNRKAGIAAGGRRQSTVLSPQEIEWIKTLCFYGHAPAMEGKVKRNVLTMKSRDIRPIATRLRQRLADKYIDGERKTAFEAMMAKLEAVLEKRVAMTKRRDVVQA
jgi:hypothetical protein